MAMAAGAAVTFGGVMAVAGGMAAGLGVISGDKDFQRLGSLLSAAGGLANAAQGLAGGAGGASDAYGIADGSMDAAESAKLVRQGADAAQVGSTVGDVGNIAQAGADLGYTDYAGAMTDVAAPQGSIAQSSQDVAASLTGGTGTQSLTDAFKTAPTAGVDAQGLAATATPAQDALAEAASSMTKNDITAMLDRGSQQAKSLFGQAFDTAGKTLNGAGQWMQKNPVASNMLFKAVEGMYGPESEALDYNRSLMERARRNANSPVRMQYQTPKTVGG